MRLLVNLLDGHSGEVELVTITAPGSDVLEWDGETVERDAAADWNASAPQRWTAINRKVRRLLSASPTRSRLLAYAWAFQARGVLHLHLVLSAETGAEKWANRLYVRNLRELAGEQGFGFVHLARAYHGRKGLAKYLAKYVSRDSPSGRPEVAETALHPDCPRRPVYVAPSLTLKTRATMRNLRLRRYYFRGEADPTVTLPELEAWWQRGVRVVNDFLCFPQELRGPPLVVPDGVCLWVAVEAHRDALKAA